MAVLRTMDNKRETYARHRRGHSHLHAGDPQGREQTHEYTTPRRWSCAAASAPRPWTSPCASSTPGKFLLVSRGFHGIIEYPLHR